VFTIELQVDRCHSTQVVEGDYIPGIELITLNLHQNQYPEFIYIGDAQRS